MKLKFKITLLLVMLVNVCYYAQDAYTLTGVVNSKGDNSPLPGVTILIQNTNKGSETDFDGNFSIQVEKGQILEFSYLGYSTQKVTISNQKTLNISLVEDASVLDEIVVVGYGTRKKSHSTGSIAKIGGDDVAAVQATRVDEALAGKLPGVLIQNQDGSPGCGSKNSN